MIVFKIKEIRERQNVSALTLSNAVNISRSYLSELENNKRINVNLKLLLSIAEYLNVNIKDLFYTAFDIEPLRQEMYRRIDEFGINSEEVLEVSQLIDLLLNIDGIIKKKDEDTEKK